MHRLLPLGLSIVAALLAGCSSPGRVHTLETQPGIPAYVCRYTREAPTIDGRLDDVAWRQAEEVRLRLTSNGETPRQPTTALALWDEKHLYVAFDCVDDDVWAGYSEPDSHIYEEEVIEVFIDENVDGRSYMELEVSPNNTVLDMYILNPPGDGKIKGFKEYECEGLKSAVVVEGTLARAAGEGPADDRGWTVEVAIPFDQLILGPNIPPRPGDLWKWNLYRIDRPAGEKARHEYSAWSPTGAINYHMPERFGWLVFQY